MVVVSSGGIGGEGEVRGCHYVREGLDFVAFPVGNDAVVYLWIRTRGKANTADVVGVYYLLPRQDNDADKLFYKQLKDISRPSFIVLVGDLTSQPSTESVIQETQKGPGNF